MIPRIIATVVSAVVVGYAFARFNFWGKKSSGILIGSWMLPKVVLLVPSYLMFQKFGWLDTYLPMIILAGFGIEVFFTFHADPVPAWHSARHGRSRPDRRLQLAAGAVVHPDPAVEAGRPSWWWCSSSSGR